MTARAPLVEREREMLAFDELLGDAGGRHADVIVVEGSAGIGKTRLLEALRDRAAAEGMRVLTARGSALEREFAFGVVRQLFEPVLGSPADRERLLAGAAASALPVFEMVPASPAGASDVSFAALHGLYWLTVNLTGDGSLLLVVDDLHWCDAPSLRFLAYLARRLESTGALLAVGLRMAESATDPVMIGELADAPGAVHVEPRPLTAAGVAELIRLRLAAEPDTAFTAACLEATGGNPLFVRQLLSSLEADGVPPVSERVGAVRDVGPRAVSRTVLMRLRRLPPTATAVARAVAVVGDGAGLALVAALAELSEDDVARAAAALARADILRSRPPLGFVHPLVRDAVYHDLPPGERELHHARAARLLADAHAPVEDVATQLLMAPPRREAWVVDVLEQAAASARRKGAADSAVAYLTRALEEPPPAERRPGLLVELGLAETLTSGPAAAAHLREAYESLEEPRRRAIAAATLARTLLFTAPAREAADVAARAAAETPPELADERQALEAMKLAAAFYGVGNERLREGRDLAPIEGAGPGAKMLAAMTSFARAMSGASAEECAALALEALDGGVLIAADPGLFPVAAIVVLTMADRDEALSAWEELLGLAHRRGSLLGTLSVNLWRGGTLLWRGDLREAELSLEAAQENFAAWGRARSRETYGPAFLGMTRVLRGDLAGARAALSAGQADDDGSKGYWQLRVARCELLLAEGRHADVLAEADEIAGRFSLIDHPGWTSWRLLKARGLAGSGRTAEGVELVREELELARRFGAPSVVGRSLRVLGTLEGQRGIEHLREAVEVLERSTSRYELAAALLALGAVLRRGRSPSEAREPLRPALELAERCGADALAEQVRAELYATGARPRTTALRGPASLTASERRVAELAAGDRSNREIAQALYVTPKTVELHLSNAYKKLGIRSRRELGRVLRTEPLEVPAPRD